MTDYVNASTGIKFGIKSIRRAHPNISIPEGADLSALGYLPLERTEPPAPGLNEIIVPGPPEEYEAGKWCESWLTQPAPPPPVPDSVTALQGMRAVKHAGLITEFLAWRSALDPTGDFEIIAFLDKAQVWRYDDPIIDDALASWNRADQKDALFILAASL